jgi:hypothetical protein
MSDAAACQVGPTASHRFQRCTLGEVSAGQDAAGASRCQEGGQRTFARTHFVADEDPAAAAQRKAHAIPLERHQPRLQGRRDPRVARAAVLGLADGLEHAPEAGLGCPVRSPRLSIRSPEVVAVDPSLHPSAWLGACGAPHELTDRRGHWHPSVSASVHLASNHPSVYLSYIYPSVHLSSVRWSARTSGAHLEHGARDGRQVLDVDPDAGDGGERRKQLGVAGGRQPPDLADVVKSAVGHPEQAIG